MKKSSDNKEQDIRSIRGGFQPKKTDKPEAQNPPSGGSSVNKPESSKGQQKR